MQLYNTYTQQVEKFVAHDKRVRLYVCGITPYDTTHLGHAFTYHTFDVLIRYLEAQGIAVTYTQNVTDIDDDILKRAKRDGKDWFALGSEWTAYFIQDMQSLNVRPPEYYPRATDVIPEIVEIDEQLIAKGYAYASAGNVYYDANKFERFGQLSHIPREQMLTIANERGNRADDPHKRNPLDFVLWQAAAAGEPSWPSPWGAGRPGWHIECTAMNRKYLGDSVDIHGGGGDLVFPHHECEIAQAESATGVVPFVRVWMHVAMVRKDGEKMSKSLGNLVWARELLNDYSPDAVRLYLSAHHYRHGWEWNLTDFERYVDMSDRWRAAALLADTGAKAMAMGGFRQVVVRALEDDLTTPQAVGALDELAGRLLAGNLRPDDLRDGQNILRECAGWLGMRLDRDGVEERVTTGWSRHLKRFMPQS
jgi:L-cysteine:1D-myo-inositol 2-amino-2-deoxy-alpha-D-glucopyranoside ligase